MNKGIEKTLKAYVVPIELYLQLAFSLSYTVKVWVLLHKLTDQAGFNQENAFCLNLQTMTRSVLLHSLNGSPLNTKMATL